MNQQTHWNPFKSLAKLDAPAGIDDFIRSFGLRPAWRDFEVVPEIRIDVDEDDKAYKVKADLPGMKKEDIEVSIDGRRVEIRAESIRKVEKKDKSYLCTERSEGMVYRSFTLPSEVDGKKAAASYSDGVLSLTLPKKPSENSHRIAVS